MPTNQLAPPDMPWLTAPVGRPNGLGPPLLNYAAPPAADAPGAAIADTASRVAQSLPSWPSVEEQRQMLQPLPGWQGTAVDAAKQWAEGVMMGTTAPGIRAYHGSPHSFEAFDTSKIGTGEGAQAYGHGLYFAGNENVARSYRDDLSPRPTGPAVDAYNAASAAFRDRVGELSSLRLANAPVPPEMLAEISALQKRMTDARAAIPPSGSMYEVNIGADPEHFLHWDKPLSEQSPQVQEALKPLGFQSLKDAFSIRPVENGHVIDYIDNAGQPKTSSRVFPTQDAAEKAAQISFDTFGRNPTGAEIVSKNPGIELKLRDAGIPGIRYLDQGSRGAGDGTHNYVVFDANTIDILRKYGIAGLIAGGGAAAAGTQQPQPPTQ